ncbi:DUF2207 domain-containing protein [Gaopeijia maritima]|uniref:DUF2207 domain-containing protein n=1 Tax=Gaopeijia maritima TaxID=3119007 RepID=UPI0032548D85
MLLRSLLVALALLATTLATPAHAQDAEEILSFDVAIEVLDGNRMLVTEQIRVRALGNRIQRGIFRDFPTSFPRFLGIGQIEAPFEVLSVTRNGNAETFALERIGGEWGRGGVRVRIGNANVYLDPGVHDYTVRYETARWMEFADEGAALYWNVTGNGWDFPILEASATVEFPRMIDGDLVELAAWTGPEGATDSDAVLAWDPASQQATVRTTRSLEPGEGLTIRVIAPPGVVEEAAPGQQAAWFRLDWGRYIEAAAIALIVTLLYVVMWFMVGRDPPKAPLVVRYEPPRGYSPAALGWLREGHWDPRLLSATLVSLAVQGLLTIRHDGDRWILKRTDASPEKLLPAEERRLFDDLFDSGKTTLTLSSSRSSKLRSAVTTLQKKLKGTLERDYLRLNRKWFAAGLLASILGLMVIALRDPYGVPFPAWFLMLWLTFWTLGTGTLVYRVVQLWRGVFKGDGWAKRAEAVSMSLFSIPFVVAWLVVFGILLFLVPMAMVLAAGVLGAVNILFYHLLEAPTLRGRGVLDQLDGFEAFLTATDADRLDRLNPPDRTPELFERYLPHAIALGVENRWAESFESAVSQGTQAPSTATSSSRMWSSSAPAWYSGGAAAGFAGLAGSLGKSFSSSLSTASSPPPSSSSGGGSSFSSGGSSGGGGGGGGGGGW